MPGGDGIKAVGEAQRLGRLFVVGLRCSFSGIGPVPYALWNRLRLPLYCRQKAGRSQCAASAGPVPVDVEVLARAAPTVRAGRSLTTFVGELGTILIQRGSKSIAT
jgi:hypothetical protein